MAKLHHKCARRTCFFISGRSCCHMNSNWFDCQVNPKLPSETAWFSWGAQDSTTMFYLTEKADTQRTALKETLLDKCESETHEEINIFCLSSDFHITCSLQAVTPEAFAFMTDTDVSVSLVSCTQVDWHIRTHTGIHTSAANVNYY